MELIAIAFMLVVGGAIAVFAMTAVTIAQKENEREPEGAVRAPDRDRIAASILFRILSATMSRDAALREIRRGTGIAAPVTTGVDIANWAESYARGSSPQERALLLEIAVQLVATRVKQIPLHQYSMLLDLSFGLGFQTDALAKLREQYGFDYVDNARHGRPREADRAGGATTFFVREQRDPGELLRILGISGSPSRQTVVAAYRKLAAQHHPDRYHGSSDEVQAGAAARFIEITRAYEELLAIYRD